MFGLLTTRGKNVVKQVYYCENACSLSAVNPENQNDLSFVLGDPKNLSHTLVVYHHMVLLGYN